MFSSWQAPRADIVPSTAGRDPRILITERCHSWTWTKSRSKRRSTEGFSAFLRRAVNESLKREDGEAFQAWIWEEAPLLLTGLLPRLPDEQARRGFLLEFGRSLWNSIPLPSNGFRPRPIPPARAQRPLSVRIGEEVQEVLRSLVGGSTRAGRRGDLDADGRGVPRWSGWRPWERRAGCRARFWASSPPLCSTMAIPRRRWPWSAPSSSVRSGWTSGTRHRSTHCSRPTTPSISRRSIGRRRSAWPPLSGPPCGPCSGRAWRGLRRGGGDGGGREVAGAGAPGRSGEPGRGAAGGERAAAEGRTAEAGERARHWRSRLREYDLSEYGFEFLARVGENPEETQLRFSFGDEVTERIHQLEEWLARAEPPAGGYTIEPFGDVSGGRAAVRGRTAPDVGVRLRGGILSAHRRSGAGGRGG